MFKLFVVVALCSFAFAQCMPAEESATHDRVRRQTPGDMMDIPIKAGIDMFHTASGMGEKVMSKPGPGGPGGMPGGMGPMGK